MINDTIFALASGALPSGVAVIRVSGPKAADVCRSMLQMDAAPGPLGLRNIRHPSMEEVLDRGLGLFFKAPASFTGEDVLELQVHGGVAVVDAILRAIGTIDGLRLAEAGEFSRRAFENDRLDLTQLEGLSDLLGAQTERQRQLAVSQSGGALRKLYDGWRADIVRARALIEAELDFADEEDVPGSVSHRIWKDMIRLTGEIKEHLDDQGIGEIIREGAKVVLLGPPNSGKSSLLNALAKRDVAIVTNEAGTTRDLLQVDLDLAGQKICVVDTAGLREAKNLIEKEGIRRAREAADEADLIVWLSPADDEKANGCPDLPNVLPVISKSDIAAESIRKRKDWLTISIKTIGGLDDLIEALRERVSFSNSVSERPIITRRRHRTQLDEALEALRKALNGSDLPIELRAEHLREAGDHLGRLTGRVDVEDLLDVIFSEFCVGK